MFGRMLADSAAFKREAAVQVARAVTTHRALAGGRLLHGGRRSEVAGRAGNLDDTRSDRDASVAALVEAAATVAPGGKQASYASRARALYVLGEKRSAQPRSLVAAFLKPVDGTDQGAQSIAALEEFRDRLDAAYGACAEEHYAMNCEASTGTLCADGGVRGDCRRRAPNELGAAGTVSRWDS